MFAMTLRFGSAGLTLLACALTLAGCQSPAPGKVEPLPPLPPLVVAGTRHCVVDPAASRVVFLVYRVGPLAALGHNHVIRARRFSGDVYINREFNKSAFSLTFPVADFEVDNRKDRVMEGPDFTTRPSTTAIAETTHNMKGPNVLDAKDYRNISVRSVKVSGTREHPVVTVRIGLRGAMADMTVPLTVVQNTDQMLSVSGSFIVKQTRFGIVPFSTMGGGLRVKDEIRIRFRIVAECAESS